MRSRNKKHILQNTVVCKGIFLLPVSLFVCVFFADHVQVDNIILTVLPLYLHQHTCRSIPGIPGTF